MSELSTQFGGNARELSKAITEDYAVVLGPIDVQDYANLGVYVENDAGDDITSVRIETGPTTTGPWALVVEALAAVVVEDASAYKAVTGYALKYVRLSAKCGAGETATANFWLCAGRFGR